MFQLSLPAFAAPVAPYIELTRLDRPLGILIIFMPIAIGLLSAAATIPNQLPTPDLLNYLAKWILLAASQLAFGCAIDDVIDKDLDAKVERCRNRPMPRGAVSMTQGIIFCTFLAFAHAKLATWTFPSSDLSIYLMISVFGHIVYPFLKRFTHYALVFLAAVYSSGAFQASKTIGVDVGYGTFFAIAIYNIIVETIYMHADLEDDLKAGINSLAVRFQGYAKQVLCSMALAYLVVLLWSGMNAGFGGYYLAGVFGSTISLFLCIACVDLRSPRSCQQYFFLGNVVVGSWLALGLYGQYAA